MTDTPEDIRAKAEAVFDAMSEIAHIPKLDRTIGLIAQALMAERERCLSILVATREFLEAEENPDYAETAIMGCLRDLEREIRSPDKT